MTAVVLAAVLVAPAGVPAGRVSTQGLANTAWPMWRHDLAHTGRSPYSGPANPVLKWKADVVVKYSGPAIAADGTVYVGGDDGKLYAINANGTTKWKALSAIWIGAAPAIGTDGTIYVGCWDKKLYAVNPDGTTKWEFATGAPLWCPAIGADGTIYIGDSTRLYAINPDGTKKWECPAVVPSPAIGPDGTIYGGGEDKKLYAVNPDGTKKWEFQTGNVIEASPAIGADGTIYVGSDDSKFYAINPDGTKKWEFLSGGWFDSSAAIASDGTVYVGGDDKKFYAFAPDGTKKWEFLTGDRIASSPAIGANGTVYFGSYDQKLYALSPTGKKQWEFMTDGPVDSSPSIGSDGTIYVGNLAIANRTITPLLVKSPGGAAYTLVRKGGVALWTFSATLRTSAGAPIASRRVYLQRSANGLTWTNAYTHTTNSSGKVSRRLAFKVKGTTYWRWSSPANATYSAKTCSKTKIVTR